MQKEEESVVVYCVIGIVGRPGSYSTYEEIVRIFYDKDKAVEWIQQHKDDPAYKDYPNLGPNYSSLYIRIMEVS